MRRFAAALAALLVAVGAARAETGPLRPFKDSLFAYPGVIAEDYEGDRTVVAYDKERDIYRRDEVPERRARWQYVSTGVNRQLDHLDYEAGGRQLRAARVGDERRQASFILVYLHGQGGTRLQGVDDWTFGGNFNRVKNLVARGGGIYLSPDFTDFEEKGAADIKALVSAYAARSPDAPVILACGSWGGVLCWRLAADPAFAPRLGGLLLLGSFPEPAFLKSAAFRARVPVYLGHGSEDSVSDWRKQDAFFQSIKKASADYPVRFVLFDTGSHGTPIRMTDWRLVLNWMLTRRGN